MQVYRSIEEFSKIKNLVLTTGTFDGVHLGHQKIIHAIKELARYREGESALLTFDPHPRKVLHAEEGGIELLTTLDEKVALLAKLGLDHLIIHPFTEAFSKLSSLNFIRDILVNQLDVKTLVIGYNHHFGRNREGQFKILQELGPIYGFEVFEIPAKDIDQIEISSTKNRKALKEGQIKVANDFLGYDFFFSGKVVKGQQVGRQLGFPTANLALPIAEKSIPANGVYWVTAQLSGSTQLYNGMMNIGTRPTIGNNGRSIEIHLLNFNADIYDQNLQVNVLYRARDEVKFASLDDLIAQLQIDRDAALRYFIQTAQSPTR